MKHWIMTLLLVVALTSCTTQTYELPPAIQKYNEQMAPKAIPSDANVRQATLAIKDMTCPSCALGVEYQLKQLDGVYNAEVKYPEGVGFAVYDSSKLSAEKIASSSTIYPAIVASDEPYEQ